MRPHRALFLLSGAVLAFSQPSRLLGFVVEQHDVAIAQDFQTTSTSYVDIPGSERVITVEAGRAVITWCLTGRTESTSVAVRVRRALGGAAPAMGSLRILESSLSELICGSWAADVSAGQIPVRLQVACDPGYPGTFQTDQAYHSLSWTLLVLPTANAGVPAVSTWGVTLLALLIVAAATLFVVFPRRVGDR